MKSAGRIRRGVGAFLLVPLLLGGCVTAKKYRLAKDGSPPAQTLDWKVATAPAELTLRALIVFKGPGSWKREARWDEYVVQFSNHGVDDCVLESVELRDSRSDPVTPGADPWKLEKLSRTNWEKYGKSGLVLLAGAGAVVATVAAAEAAAMGAILAGGTTAGGAIAMNVIPAALLVNTVVVGVMDHRNKKAVEAEFARRRLVLPATVAPGGSLAGSWFFPMTPGPQRLMVRGRAGAQPFELVIGLSPLAGLHLKPARK